jgi:SRSO17 transposase
VHLSYVAGGFHCLLDGELFLPESWSQDRQRCREARIPEEMTYRPKWQIGLELHQQAVANGIRFEWLTFDEQYGQVPQFLFALDDRGQRYVAEVPCTFTGWLRKPDLLRRNHHRRPGRARKTPRLKAKSPSPSTVRNLLRHSPVLREVPWETFHIKDTTKGPMVWQVKAARFYLKREGLPSRAHWLVLARNKENRDEVKFFVSNAPEGTPLEVLLHVAFSRWHVERCFQDEKDKIGLSHFEVRNYVSLRRHLIVTALSHLFLARLHQLWRGEKARTDRLPTSHGLFSAGPIAVDDRPGTATLPPPSRPDHRPDPTAQRPSPPQPRPGQTETAA